MARTNSEITPAEVQAYTKYCIEHGIINDGSQDDQHNADFIWSYFVNTCNQDITEQNLNTAWDRIRPHLKLCSPAQLEYYKLANQEPDRANQLANWLATQGKSKQLVNQGDEAFVNLRLLLISLRGYDINSTTIRHAEDRIQSKPGRKLHYVPTPRKEMGTITEAARNDDGVEFLGRLVKQSDGSYRSKSPAEYRREAEAAERAKSQPQTTTLDPSEAAWKNLADGLLRDGTHSQQQRVRAVYDHEQGQGSWRRVYEACKREANIYKNRSFAR